MTAFDKWIRPGMTVREVRQRYPETRELMESFGFRGSCDDCSLEVVARRQGLNVYEVVDQMNRAAALAGDEPAA